MAQPHSAQSTLTGIIMPSYVSKFSTKTATTRMFTTGDVM